VVKLCQLIVTTKRERDFDSHFSHMKLLDNLPNDSLRGEMTTSVAATNAAVIQQFGVATQLWCPSTGTFSTASAVLSNKVVRK